MKDSYLIIDKHGNVLGTSCSATYEPTYVKWNNFMRDTFNEICKEYDEFLSEDDYAKNLKTSDYLTNRYKTLVTDGATILFDKIENTKTVVKRAKDDNDDIEKSILWAFLKSRGYSTKDLNIFTNTYTNKRTAEKYTTTSDLINKLEVSTDALINKLELAKEQKSKRLNLLIKPTIHRYLKDKAEKNNTSVNDLINQILEDSLLGD